LRRAITLAFLCALGCSQRSAKNHLSQAVEITLLNRDSLLFSAVLLQLSKAMAAIANYGLQAFEQYSRCGLTSCL
jgi:hypothetical protein